MAALQGLHRDLVDQVEGLVRGGSCVVVEGMPHSGRSTVLTRALDRLEDSGWTTVRLRGVAALRDRPLEALAVGPLGPVAAQERPRAATPVAAFVTALGHRVHEPFVLGVDDADLLDDATVGVLASTWATHRFPVVLTEGRSAGPLRGGSLTATLSPSVRLDVPTLVYGEVVELLQEILGGRVDPHVVGRVSAKSGGLPGLVVAIARGGRRLGAVDRRDGVWHAGRDLWTPDLVAPTDRLLVGLDAQELDALYVLSLTGAVGAETAARLVPQHVLESLESRGLLRSLSRHYQSLVGVYPPLIGEMFRHARSETTHLRVSASIEAALERRADVPVTGTRDARTEVPARDGSAVRPVPHPLPGPPAPDVRERIAVLNRHLSDEIARQVLVRGDEWRTAPTAANAVPYLRSLVMARADPASVEVVARATEPPEDPTERALLLAWQAMYAALVERDLPRARLLLDRAPVRGDATAESILESFDRNAVLLLDRVPPAPTVEPPDPGYAHDLREIVSASAALVAGHSRDASRTLDALTSDDESTQQAKSSLHGLVLLFRGDFTEALSWSVRHLDESLAARQVADVWSHAYVVSFALVCLGRFADLRETLATLLPVGVFPPRQAHFAAGTMALGAWVALGEGRPQRARLLAEQADALGPSGGPLPLTSTEWLLDVVRARADGDAVREADVLWSAFEDARSRGFLLSATVVGCLAVDALPDPARGDAVARVASSLQWGSGAPWGGYPRAVCDPDPEVTERFGRDVLAAGFPLLGGRALAHAVRRWRAAGRADRAAAIVDAVRRVAVDEGLVRLVDPTSAPTLSPREREVARLVDAGLSNHQVAARLHLSVSTVENHLNRIYRKLGVEGRHDLGAALARDAR
ncbi:helix-turn-helix transcriptional regulator [Cellulosimicrobium cellulans]|uniref:helix-turn-helix transcriptional regulator n=1 Tax=Cellulosimicrobium cellulans TaxID=1710 RepID=UPI001EDC0B9B|nr:helix-turn-helix transcriptional regulator [Cellulosimicrobium cellulans]UKJ62814.1 helix-turn-helix transcriptional regulator [Cellulosimicrobium cellulans]